MNIAKKTCYSNSPSRLRRSVALISAAILLSTNNAQAEIKIGRLPSTNAGSGEVIGAKPNVFLIIDNSKSMTGSKNQMEYDPNGNYLQQTAGALIAALPQLEGKVRLGYSTIFPGTYVLNRIKYGSKQLSCQEFKLNGNVDRLAPFIPGLKEDLAKNPNYVTGAEDFVFNDSGSGYGNTVPRDFRDNYARYIYAWLGAMCMGNTSDKDGVPYNNPWTAPLVPPYADLNDKAAYKAAAIAANNKNSYPIANFVGTNVMKDTHKPLIDMYARVLGQVSDEKFICSLDKSQRGGSSCVYTDLSAERGARGNATLRNYPEHPQWKYLTYDAYAPSRPDNGFPDDKNPLSCRKNYTIMISHGAYGDPGGGIRSNTSVGVGSNGINGLGSGNGWRMPNGREFPLSGYLGEITRMYRFHPAFGDSELRDIPISYTTPKGTTGYFQGSGRKFLLSKMILQSYYQDLRSNLPDDVSPYVAGPTRRDGPNKKGIPPFWDRKNDTAPWQHMTFFALGFTDENGSSFPSWQYANKAYKPYYSDLDPEGGILEPYFRAIEDGTIYAENQPLPDWGRGGFGLNNLPMSRYFYKNPTTHAKEQLKIGPDHFQGDTYLEAYGELLDMDYAKAGIIGRGGAYEITDYHSIKKVIKMIADRIETAMAQGITGGAVGGGGRITASSQTSTPNTLFATYVNEEELNGNVFAYRNCPVTPKKIPEVNDDGSLKRDPSSGQPIMIDNPEWAEQQCGQRLWNAATVLDNELKANPQAMAQKTIVPIKDASGTGLTGDKFTWATLDDALKTALKDGHDDATGQARVEWINGKLHSEFDATMQKKLRKRGTVAIPIEGQRYKLDGSGQPEKDPDGNFIFADPTSIANRIGEIVYAVPKAIDNTGTLPSGHPLNVNIGANNYADFVKNTVRKRKPLVMAGSNDGHLYAFTDPGRDLNYAELAFSYIPRAVAIAPDRLVKFTDPDLTAQTPPPSLVNGPFTVRDAQVDGKWGTYVVGTLGPATATNAVEGGTIYALDISNGRADNDIFKWEVNIAGTDGGNPNIMAEPRIIWLRKPCTGTATTCAVDGKWVVLVTSGYNATNTSLVVLDLKDGSELARINTGAMYTEDSTSTDDLKTCQLNPLKADNTDQNLANVHKSLIDVYGAQGKAYLPKASFISCDNGLGALTVFDADNDGGADYVFAGDLFGHVWKFDLTGFYDKNTGNQAANLNQALKVSYDSPLFIAQSPNSSDQVNDKSPRQPITAMIDIADGAYGEGSMLYIGTGRLFNQQERAFSQRQSYYGIWDIPRYTKQKKQGKISDNWSLPLLRDTNNKPYRFMQYEAFAINSSAVKETTSELKDYKELRGLKHKNWQDQPDMTYLSYDLEGGKSANPNAKLVGWSIDFPADNKFERVIERGRVFEDTLFFPSFEPPNDSEPQEQCTPDKGGVGGNGRFYMVDRMTGAQPKISPFDFTGDGSQSKEDGVELKPSDLGLTADAAKKAGYTVTGENGNEVVSSSVAGILIGPVPSSFLTLDTVLGRVKLTDSTAKCDYNRQVIFPGTLDPVTGQPRILTSCNINRYRVWKQPIEE